VNLQGWGDTFIYSLRCLLIWRCKTPKILSNRRKTCGHSRRWKYSSFLECHVVTQEGGKILFIPRVSFGHSRRWKILFIPRVSCGHSRRWKNTFHS